MKHLNTLIARIKKGLYFAKHGETLVKDFEKQINELNAENDELKGDVYKLETDFEDYKKIAIEEYHKHYWEICELKKKYREIHKASVDLAQDMFYSNILDATIFCGDVPIMDNYYYQGKVKELSQKGCEFIKKFSNEIKDL